MFYIPVLLAILLHSLQARTPYHQLSQEEKKERKRNNTFMEFDRDKDGFITMKDIEGMLGSIHKNSYFKMFFDKYDINKDGKVDLNEYHIIAMEEYNRWEEIEEKELTDEEIEEQKQQEEQRQKYKEWRKKMDEKEAIEQEKLRKLYHERLEREKKEDL